MDAVRCGRGGVDGRIGRLALLGLAVLAGSGAGPGATGPPRGAVVLRKEGGSTAVGPGIDRGVLVREVVRQAYLLAAREEMGLATRDEALSELPPDAGNAGLVVSVDCLFNPPEHNTNGPGLFLMAVRDGDPNRFNWRDKVPLTRGERLDYAEMIERVEAFSRGRAVEVLKLAGFEARPRAAARPGAAVPEEVEARLRRMSPFDQFAAIRALHAAIREGESPALVGALVRGYANLGVLTEHHWSRAHKVFKARALLYAQRLAARDGGSAWADWHRAYARTLAGFHADALADLAAAARRPAGPGKAPARPGWVDLLDAACRYQTEPLHTARGGEHGELALLLRFLAVENKSTPHLTLEAGREFLEARPEGLRVLDGMCEVGGVSAQHELTLRGLSALADSVAEGVGDLPGLPAPVRDAVENGDVARTLIDAGRPGADDRELTWAALGQIVRESWYVSLYRRTYFMARMWSVPVGDFLDDVRPLVADHPLGAYLETFALAGEPWREAFGTFYTEAFLRRYAELDGRTAWPILPDVRRFDPKARDGVALVLRTNGDAVARDLGFNVEIGAEHVVVERARELERVSPHSPRAAAARIVHDWEAVKDRAAAWEAEFDAHPTVLRALAVRYAQLGRPEDAERCAGAAIRRSPDLTTYRLLADSYRDRGQVDRWRETLDQYLDQEDVGLDHARVRVEIANEYMARRKYAEARPYAEAAAESYAQWAMQCAAVCFEGLKDYEKAEAWVRAESERYDAPFRWFFWCKRTGKGDADAAKRHVEQEIRNSEAIGRQLFSWPLGLFRMLAGDRRAALAVLRESYRANRIVGEGILAAALAEELGEPVPPELTWAELAKRKPELTADPRLAVLAELFRDAPDGRLDLAAVNKMLGPPGPDNALADELALHVAEYLRRHGRRAEAIRYYRRCYQSDTAQEPFVALAAEALRAEAKGKPAR